MRIVHARLHPLEVPMSSPIKMAGETLTHAHTLLLCLTDEQGRQGWGEASAAPLMTGETLDSLSASTGYLLSRLIDAEFGSPRDIAALQDKVLYGNASAKSCHATALLDLMAQRAGLPLHRLLADTEGAAPEPEPLQMLQMLAAGDLEAELEQALALRGQGIRHWKIKVGAAPLADDLRRVESLCDALRGDVISADANTALSVESALAIARAGVDGGLAFLEQPFPPEQIADMAELHRRSGLPLCADESIHGLADIDAHHALAAAQGASLKLIKCGGPLAMALIGRHCLGLGMRVNLACKVAETTISAAATAHAGLAVGRSAWGFSMSNRYLAQDVCGSPLAPRDGAVHADQLAQPGLGYAAEAARLAEFASRNVAGREWPAR